MKDFIKKLLKRNVVEPLQCNINPAWIDALEENEPDNLLREIVVHPDGHISGS